MNGRLCLVPDPRTVRCLLVGLATSIFLVVSASSLIHAQTRTGQTLKLGQNEASPKASIKDVAWIAGSWQGTAFDGVCDEIWSPPAGNSMMGMFRLVKNGKTVFHELMTIVEENHTLVMKLKHFGADLKGWEEKNVTQNFPLVKITANEAFFDGLTYRKRSDGSLQIFLAQKQQSGEVAEEEILLRPTGR